MSTGVPPAPLRVALTALGCKVNFAEMAELAGALAAAGLDVVPEHEHADVRVLNSCTVTMQADATTRQRLGRLRRFDPAAHLVLTGCSVDANPDRYQRRDPGGRVLPPPGVDAVFANPDKAAIAEHILALPSAVPGEPSGRTQGRSRAFVKVQDGCDHRCTYCIVWRARGASLSVPPASVRERVHAALAGGHREVVLCGVDLGSYGRDLGLRLSDLVATVLAELPPGTRLRLSSVNANDVTPALIALNAHPQLCAHWHMPLQSGSDNVLRAMHRGYRRAQYLRVVAALREQDPATEFTTDVMVAFPGESDADHDATLDLIAGVGFLSCHVFRWSPRPDTPAVLLDRRVDHATARRRSAEARRVASAARERSMLGAVGRVHDVVWDSVVDGTAHGLSATYHELVVRTHELPLPGTMSRVRAEAIEDDHLRATLAGTDE